MKHSLLVLPVLTAAVLLLQPLQAAPPDSSAMHLNGKLNQAGAPASGEHEFRFQLFTGPTGDTVVPKTQTLITTEMVNAGNWQTALDLRRFGGEKSILDNTVFPADQAVSILDDTVIPTVGDRAILDNTVRTAMQQSWRAVEGNWLQISVRRKGATTFVLLSPRQKLGAVPRAATAFSAEHAAVAGSVSEGGIDGRAIAASAINTDALRDLAVIGSKISPGAITPDKLAPAAINTDALRDLAVIGSKIASGTVVRSLNGLRDDVTLSAGTGITLGGQGNNITINAIGNGNPPMHDGNFLGAGADNTFGASAMFGFIGGGEHNKISNQNEDSFLGGGELNQIYERSSFSTLAGGKNNSIAIDSANSVIGGGSGNTASGDHAAVLSGQNNLATSYATVGGGVLNKAQNNYATVPGGFQNQANGVGSFAAGYNARATHSGSFVWNGFGGNGSFASSRDGEFAVNAPGGLRFQTGGRGLMVDGVNVTGGGGGAVADGSVNTAQLADRAVTLDKLAVNGNPGNGMLLSFSGGSLLWTPPSQGGGAGWALGGNTGTDPLASFLGTVDDKPLSFRVNNVGALKISRGTFLDESGVTLAAQNTVFNSGLNLVAPGKIGITMAGGATSDGDPALRNSALSHFATISGGVANTAGSSTDPYANAPFIGGGFLNSAFGGGAVVAGGTGNKAGNFSAVAGGAGNEAQAGSAVIGGGVSNTIMENREAFQSANESSGILGGRENAITNSFYAFIGGGASNVIQELADGAVIGGGRFNEAWGIDSVVSGGRSNSASGAFSFAAGHSAKANHRGSFVWNDASGGQTFSLRENEFTVHATGGVRIETGGAGLLVDGVPFTGGGGGGVANGSVNTLHLADRAVNVAKLAVNGNPANGMFLSYSGGSLQWTPAPQGGGSGWALGGNAATDPAANFIGTLDDQPVNFRANNTPVLKLARVTETTSSGGVFVSQNAVFNPGLNYMQPGIVGVTMAGGATFNGDVTYKNTAVASFVTIAGGVGNTAGRLDRFPNTGGTVGGGAFNSAFGFNAVVAGGYANWAGDNAGVLGGQNNDAFATLSVIAGGSRNTIVERRSEWSGYGNFSGIAGGQWNSITNSFHSHIGGGASNRVHEAADGAVISGGRFNAVQQTAASAVIGGGISNTVFQAAVGAVISGGRINEAWGIDSMIPGGRNNTAYGNFSFAAGNDARANHNGAFVWNDNSGTFNASVRDNEFAVRASGGVRFNTDGAGMMVFGDLFVDGTVTATVVNTTSDRNAKQDFKAVDGREVLAKVAAMPISEWQFKNDGAGSRHVGPMAQDFHAAFGVGADDRHISSVDADGVALAAIQGLHAEAQEKDARIRQLEEQVRRLDEIVRKLADRP